MGGKGAKAEAGTDEAEENKRLHQRDPVLKLSQRPVRGRPASPLSENPQVSLSPVYQYTSR
jgi:hypothetical protein